MHNAAPTHAQKPKGRKVVYAEGWKIINLANEAFGVDGWSSTIVSVNTEFMDYDEIAKRYTIGVSAVLRIALVKSGVFREDTGYGMIENIESKGQGLDKCRKEAVTDALKRCLKQFETTLAECLRDKGYDEQIIDIRIPPSKFHRRPVVCEECNADEKKPRLDSDRKYLF